MAERPGFSLPTMSIPSPDDSVSTAGYWRWLREHQLRIQRCTACGRTRNPAGEVCHACGSTLFEWIPVPAEGRVYSWTRVWHPVNETLEGHVPYLVAWIEVEHPDHPRFVGNIVGDPMQDVAIGDPVTGVFEDRSSGTILNWRRDDA